MSGKIEKKMILNFFQEIGKKFKGLLTEYYQYRKIEQDELKNKVDIHPMFLHILTI